MREVLWSKVSTVIDLSAHIRGDRVARVICLDKHPMPLPPVNQMHLQAQGMLVHSTTYFESLHYFFCILIKRD